MFGGEEQAAVENFVKKFRLKPRRRQGREFGRGRETTVVSYRCKSADQNAEPFQVSGS